MNHPPGSCFWAAALIKSDGTEQSGHIYFKSLLAPELQEPRLAVAAMNAAQAALSLDADDEGPRRQQPPSSLELALGGASEPLRWCACPTRLRLAGERHWGPFDNAL